MTIKIESDFITNLELPRMHHGGIKQINDYISNYTWIDLGDLAYEICTLFTFNFVFLLLFHVCVCEQYFTKYVTLPLKKQNQALYALHMNRTSVSCYSKYISEYPSPVYVPYYYILFPYENVFYSGMHLGFMIQKPFIYQF